MSSFIKTVVGGAIGLAALYVVGRIAYQVGHDVAEVEHRKTEMPQIKKEEEKNASDSPSSEERLAAAVIPIPKKSFLSSIFGLKRLTDKKESVIGRLIHHPEMHQIEAYIDGEELRVKVKPKAA